MQPQKNANTHVTNRTGSQFAELLRKHGITRKNLKENFFQNEVRRNTFLSDLIQCEDWYIKAKFDALSISGEIQLLVDVPVDYSKSHTEAALSGLELLDADDVILLSTASAYHVPETKKIHETVILFKQNEEKIDFKEVLKWASRNNLRKTTPHVPFAIGSQFPCLHKQFSVDNIYLFETTGMTSEEYAEACCVYFSENRTPGSAIFSLDGEGESNCFAFRK